MAGMAGMAVDFIGNERCVRNECFTVSYLDCR